MKIGIRNVFLIIACLVAVYFIYSNSQNKQGLKSYEYNTSVMADSIMFLKDKDGNNQAAISTFQGQETKMFLNLETKDKEILSLQKEVEKAKNNLKKRGSVTNFRSNTKIDTVFVPTITYSGDSSLIYASAIDLDTWITGLVIAGIDSIYLELEVRNKYSIVVGEEKQGLFKPKKPFVMVTNHNPYTQTTSLRTYQVELPKPKKFYVGPFIGINIELQPVIGIGIGYSLTKF